MLALSGQGGVALQVLFARAARVVSPDFQADFVAVIRKVEAGKRQRESKPAGKVR